MSESPELLVVLADESGGALERVAETHRVIHVGSPRMVVVATSSGASDEALRSLSGVAAVADAELPTDVVERLGPEERLFALAWLRRMTEKKKERPGEGLPWDAPGFTPPDPPSSRSD